MARRDQASLAAGPPYRRYLIFLTLSIVMIRRPISISPRIQLRTRLPPFRDSLRRLLRRKFYFLPTGRKFGPIGKTVPLCFRPAVRAPWHGMLMGSKSCEMRGARRFGLQRAQGFIASSWSIRQGEVPPYACASECHSQVDQNPIGSLRPDDLLAKIDTPYGFE